MIVFIKLFCFDENIFLVIYYLNLSIVAPRLAVKSKCILFLVLHRILLSLQIARNILPKGSEAQRYFKRTTF